MAVHVITGKLGNGKTLVSVGRIRDRLRAGRPVATNLDLDLVAMLGPNAKHVRVIRIPDKPNVDDLHSLGNANPTYDESNNGLLVLDECGTWFNSRNWNDPARKAVNDWFLHARKLGWDMDIIVQDVGIIDSQFRDAVAEHTAFCKRIDNLHIPVIGTLIKALTGLKLRLPRAHVARVVLGTSPRDLLADRWAYRGTELFRAYDTKQIFLADYPHGTYSLLSPWHTTGRHRVPMTLRNFMRLTRIYWRRFRSPVALAAGVLVGVALAAAAAFAIAHQQYRDGLAAIETQQAALEDERQQLAVYAANTAPESEQEEEPEDYGPLVGCISNDEHCRCYDEEMVEIAVSDAECYEIMSEPLPRRLSRGGGRQAGRVMQARPL